MKKENNIKVRGNKKGRGRESLGSFVPKKIFSSEKHKAERFNAIVFCADISGFTNMSEKLSALGKEGSEEITKVINLFFKPLVEIILSRRGDIFFFGGDAITALFRDSDGLSALFAAEEAVDYVKNHSIVSTSQGDFKISIHIALNRGKIFFYDSGRNYFLGGDVCYKVIDLLDEAEGGEIVLGKDLKEEVKEAKCVKIHEKAYKLKLLDLKRIPRKSKFICTETDKRISSYIPEWLRKQADAKQEFDQKNGEHRKASILFAHVREIPFDTENKESTEISKHLTKALLKNSEKYRGWINKIDFYKDGLRALVVFGYPEKLANDDEHAVLFAEELLSDLKNTKASVSIGVNSGSIFKTPVGSKDRMEITVMGDTVNTAARIAAKAEPGTVCAGAAVYENTKKRLKFKELESKKMKGKSKPVRIFQYESGKKTNEEEGVSEWLSESREMVGNRDVMSSLIKSAEDVKNQKSVVFALEGHAGLGKSRIVREIKKVLRDDNFKVLQGNCLSYGSPLSYHPWIEIISSLFGFESHDSTEAKMKKVLRLLDSTGKSMSEWLPLIGEVLSLDFGMNDLVKNLDKSVKKEKFYDIVTGMLCFLSEKNPLALVIEDYHWADNSSSELLSHLSRNCKDKRILFVIPFRPSEGKTSTEVLNEDVRFVLRELSPAETGELIDNLLNVKNLDNSIKKLVAEKSQGNPFYVEELVKSMIEQKYITKTNECWSFDMKGREVALPDSVEGVILSRIDRLDIAERNVLQTASVLGREFRYEILNSLCKEEKSLKRILSRLNGLDLIKTDEGESEEFFFKHILTCETAYNTLSFAKRREIHFQAGSVLEKDNLNIASNTGMLSYHFHKANAFTKSMDYSIKAGERAKVVYANDEAIEYFSRALEDYSADKEKEKKLAALAYEGRASVFSFVGRGDEGIKDAETSIKIAQEIQDEELTALCLSESCIIYELTSNFDRMKDSAEKALSIYKNKSDVIGMARSYNYIGMYYGITGEPIKELEMLKEAVELLSDRTKLDDGKIPDNASAEAYQLLGVVLNNIGYVQRMLGETNAALENYEKSLELRKLIKDTTGVAQVLNNIGMIYGRGGDIPKALPYFEESIKTYEEIGNKKGLGSSLVNYGYLSGRAGDSKKELECYEKGLAIQRQINDRYVMSFTLGNIGNYYLRMNNPYKALEYQMESLSIKKEINDRTGMAAAYSNIARCYEVLGDAEKRFENMREELKIYEEAGDEKKAAELREKMKE